MAELKQVLGQLQSAETTQYEVAEINGVRLRDDGSVEVDNMTWMPKSDTSCTDDDTGESEGKESEMNFDATPSEDMNRADEAGAGAEPDTSEIQAAQASANRNWADVEWNTIESVARMTEENTGHTRPEKHDKDSLVGWLNEVGVPVPENLDDSGSTDAEKAETGENEDEGDTSNESDTNDENDSVSDEYLLNNGVPEKYLEDAREHREDYGVCPENGCVYGCAEDSDYCASHKNQSKKSDKNTDNTPSRNRDLSELSTTEQKSVNLLMENEGKTLEEAMEMVGA